MDGNWEEKLNNYSMIQRYYHQELSPNAIVRDSRGTLIQKDLRVAYNYQGAVIIGQIISCKSTWDVERPGVGSNKWWYCNFELKVLNEEGHISTIKNPNSFVII
jgi:hypothetical protein